MDGHSSLLSRNDPYSSCHPTQHTTNLTQPLDKGVFSAYVCHEFITQNPGRVISTFQHSSTRHGICQWQSSISRNNRHMPHSIVGLSHCLARINLNGLTRTRWLSKQGSSTFQFVRGQVTKMPMRENNHPLHCDGNDSDDSSAEENPCANALQCLLCRRNPVRFRQSSIPSHLGVRWL